MVLYSVANNYLLGLKIETQDIEFENKLEFNFRVKLKFPELDFEGNAKLLIDALVCLFSLTSLLRMLFLDRQMVLFCRHAVIISASIQAFKCLHP